MLFNSAARIIQELFILADIEINGFRPWDIQIHDQRFYRAVLNNPVLGLAETYINGWWDCAALDIFFTKGLHAHLDRVVKKDKHFLFNIIHAKLNQFLNYFVNLQSKKRAFEVGKKHYDLGNQLYKYMLDKNLNYSCAYWKNANSLDDAQIVKLELICQKLNLQPGMRVLDIGCGWGAFSKYAAQNYNVTVVGITVSKEQCDYAQNICQGLPVEIRLEDYRKLNEKFDRICSIGMFEHVGPKNYTTYMQVAHRCLKKEGLFLLHTIGGNLTTVQPNEWIHKYIFPNGHIPSIQQIGKAIEPFFVMEDWHNFGADYDKTLMAWYDNFNQHWPEIKHHYDCYFYRMWNYYLLSCAGAFRARDIQLWQIVLSKEGVINGYQSIR